MRVALHGGMREIEMTTAEEGQRLDRYLRKLMPSVPLGAIFKQLRRGLIKVDGKKAKPDLRLVAGMLVRVVVLDEDLADAPASAGADVPHESLPRVLQPRIVYRDEHVLVVEKPSGLAVQPGSGHDHNLLTWLDAQPFGVRTRTYRPAPVHRLDRDTSGLVACGLTPAASRGLADSFRGRLIAKVYFAVVEGRLPGQHGVIEAPLHLRTSARAHQPKVLVDEVLGKEARTGYEVQRCVGDRSLLRLTLHTGRTHQIRAHLAHVGHPLLGDTRYGAATGKHPTFLLHAAELAFDHPESGERIELHSEPPASFARAMANG